MRFRLMIFIIALAAGIGGWENISEKLSFHLHLNCVHWDEQTPARSLFTLKEVKPPLGKKVHL